MSGRYVSTIDLSIQVFSQNILAVQCGHCDRLCLLQTCRGCRCPRAGRNHIACGECIVRDQIAPDNLADILLPMLPTPEEIARLARAAAGELN